MVAPKPIKEGTAASKVSMRSEGFISTSTSQVTAPSEPGITALPGTKPESCSVSKRLSL
ncbi:MAG: hypothetical protein MUO67_14625 [Anaerolineales bacterium]|nr:hypothetical protein [Anaerolineales bacterium]